MNDRRYTRRFFDDYLDRVMTELPAFMIVGPRASGKTTSAARRARSVIRLDDPAEAAAMAAQLDTYLDQQSFPVLIDEWQELPESLRAVKWSVDADPQPGRFLITGSVRSRHLGGTWPGTGRLTLVPVSGLTRAEIEGELDMPQRIDRLFEGEIEPRRLDDAPTPRDYLEWAACGGFPEAVRLASRTRADWFDGYLDQLIGRDVDALAEVREPGLMRRLLLVVAHNTAGLVSKESLARTTGANARTIDRYLGVLEELGIITRLPGWHTSALKGMARAPKYHVADTGLAMHLANVTAGQAASNGDLLGRYFESFALAQIAPAARFAGSRPELSHLRESAGRREVDLILTARGGAVVGIEVKATHQVTPSDHRHLGWLRDMVGADFAAGIVIHTGNRVMRLDDRIWAMPLAALWR